jgi:hypothetical protein
MTKREIRVLVLVVFVTFCFFVSGSFAQRKGVRWKGSGGWGAGAAYNRVYDPKTVETMSGKVGDIDIFTPMARMDNGVKFILKTEKEEVSVHLGPMWYVLQQDIDINPNDEVEVIGSRVSFGGESTIIAAQVKKGEKILKLRDENGSPFWCALRSP